MHDFFYLFVMFDMDVLAINLVVYNYNKCSLSAHHVALIRLQVDAEVAGAGAAERLSLAPRPERMAQTASAAAPPRRAVTMIQFGSIFARGCGRIFPWRRASRPCAGRRAFFAE